MKNARRIESAVVVQLNHTKNCMYKRCVLYMYKRLGVLTINVNILCVFEKERNETIESGTLKDRKRKTSRSFYIGVN